MNFVYVVLEISPQFDRVVYPEAYKTYDDALAAMKTRVKWAGFLTAAQEDARLSETIDELWNETVRAARQEGNITHFYIEKEIFIEIHKLPISA